MASRGLSILLDKYLSSQKADKSTGDLEFEVRFGTGKFHSKISKEQHDAVISKALSAGYTMAGPVSTLKVSKEDGTRLEVTGEAGISSYCRNDDPAPLLASNQAIIGSKTRLAPPVDVDDYELRVTLSSESKVHDDSVLDGWDAALKFYRLVERVSLSKAGLPFRIDVSVVKQGASSARRYAEAQLDEALSRYEIELEAVELEIGVGTSFETAQGLYSGLKPSISLVLSALQGSNFPLPRSRRQELFDQYCATVGKSCQFVGPSSISLQIDNVAPPNLNTRIVNVREGYTVTDKADGLRKLLFINKDGVGCFIDTNLRVQDTGMRVTEKAYANTIIDGEHILNGKNGSYINVFAAFDIYWLGGKPVAQLPFASAAKGDRTRLALMTDAVSEFGKVAQRRGSVRCIAKIFHQVDKGGLFDACSFVLDRASSVEYETDGIILTPASLPVGASSPDGAPVLGRTWERSFKWKPPQYNTVDFLVSVVKNNVNMPIVKNMFQKGTSTTHARQGTSYVTAVLKVGFDESKHGYLNPCESLRQQGRADGYGKTGKRGKYRPVQFFPTTPSDPKAGLTNIEISVGPSGRGPMVCEEGDVMEDNTVVEFRYDLDAEEGWRWKPLRVRYDKTEKLRSGKPSYGNAYHVANSNWLSIHNPVTEEMIRTGKGIGDELAGDNLYYTALSTASYTKALRDFHNLWVKKRLIVGACRPGGTLIDLACGRGGDLPKWIAANLKFVYGLDLVDDNISNRLDGACARYLNYAKKMRHLPKALFNVGDATVNVREGIGIASGEDKLVNMAVFGVDSSGSLPSNVRSVFGVGRDGFDVCSVQFAIHYMFKNSNTLNNCLRNIAEVTKLGGYFIGTCYDGSKVFDMLRNTEVGGSVARKVEDTLIWAMKKRYDKSSFPADASSLGMAIDVYQETIGKTFMEYLVNTEYLADSLEAFGFATLSPEELKQVELPVSVGGFSVLYDQLMDRSKGQNRVGQAKSMTPQEKDISFLNTFFIFKKVRTVDAAEIARVRMGETLAEDIVEKREREDTKEAINKGAAQAERSRYKFTKTERTITLRQVE